MAHREERRGAVPLALGLGWFSIGLGLAEVLAPRGLARLIGIPQDSETTLRLFGIREIGSGLGILAQPDRSAWLWSRVGGDAIDIAYLLSSLDSDESDNRSIAMALAAVLGVTALDVLCARQLSGDVARGGADDSFGGSSSRGVKVERVTTINRPVSEVYRFWRNFENLPRFMRHLESVETLEGRRSRWRAKGPAGLTVEWEAELLQDRPDEWIAWQSLPGSRIENSGSVRFSEAPAGRGTELRIQLRYVPPAGAFGRTLARLFGEEPDQQVHEDLHRFKQLMETGEIPLSDGPSLWRPARPVADPNELRALVGVER